MSPTTIQTDELELVLNTPDKLRAQIEAMSASDRAQVSNAWWATAMAATVPDPWIHGFTVVHRASGAAIGNCGFKGPPSNGRVEIAYGIDEGHRRRGYATQAARALTSFALDHDDVEIVLAHTLPEENASTRILRGLGFAYVGEVIDPEDGLVWRWEQAATKG